MAGFGVAGGDFVPEPFWTNDLKGQIADGIVNRLLSLAQEIKNHPKYRLQNLREDMRIELNPKDPRVETCLRECGPPDWALAVGLLQGH